MRKLVVVPDGDIGLAEIASTGYDIASSP